MISLADLTADVQQYWQAALGGQIPTQFPGVPLDATGLPAWMEFWLTQGREPARRQHAADELIVLLDVHCFSRRTDKRAVFRMADSCRSNLAQQLIPLRRLETPDATAGYLRLFEATTRDLTRDAQQLPRLPLQHVVVSLAGRVEMPILPAIDS